ncbi:MAG: hypothetical protein Q9196_002859, partial [Gyalolechia fulgens]
MDTSPTDHDKSLLDRLNALKKSSISFDTSSSDVADLSARFRKLNGSRKTTGDLVRSVAEAATNPEDDPPSPTVEELLADLGPEEQWQLDRDETFQINSLMEEAGQALHAREEDRHGVSRVDEARDQEGSSKGHSGSNKEKEEDEDDEEAALHLG